MKARFLLTALLLSSAALASDTQETIDFGAFLNLSEEAMAHRADRLVDIATFNTMAEQQGTVILDTRSRAAYELRHLRGAVHLNLSDMTAESLARVLGPTTRRVLIYCNNNFLNDPAAFATKAPPAALNIPTFATLFIYDYRNVFELSSLLDVSDPRLEFDGRMVSDHGERGTG